MKKNFLAISLFLLISSLSACKPSTYTTVESVTVYHPVLPPKISLSSLRAGYQQALREHGVQIIKIGETFRFVLLSDPVFRSDSANIRDNYRDVLKTLAALINTYDKVDVQVAGYTDNLGNIKRQQALTTRQAQVIANFLWTRGINARFVDAQGYNRQNPVDSNNRINGRQNNRRIEVSFRFYPKYVPYA